MAQRHFESNAIQKRQWRLRLLGFNPWHETSRLVCAAMFGLAITAPMLLLLGVKAGEGGEVGERGVIVWGVRAREKSLGEDYASLGR